MPFSANQLPFYFFSPGRISPEQRGGFFSAPFGFPSTKSTPPEFYLTSGGFPPNNFERIFPPPHCGFHQNNVGRFFTAPCRFPSTKSTPAEFCPSWGDIPQTTLTAFFRHLPFSPINTPSIFSAQSGFHHNNLGAFFSTPCRFLSTKSTPPEFCPSWCDLPQTTLTAFFRHLPFSPTNTPSIFSAQSGFHHNNLGAFFSTPCRFLSTKSTPPEFYPSRVGFPPNNFARILPPRAVFSQPTPLLFFRLRADFTRTTLEVFFCPVPFPFHKIHTTFILSVQERLSRNNVACIFPPRAVLSPPTPLLFFRHRADFTRTTLEAFFCPVPFPFHKIHTT
ncbi:hypothetical protein T11_14693 [Trichinella zimbabwensis]|uniref:Uncharacterized protein n=1 Tax=Trichinella zimbabwensis TaxID=268475 RepID=A0A0V1GPQ7_9BILA|nr:hypothetical protein T11_14693 [Trichinella zimbabwensis]